MFVPSFLIEPSGFQKRTTVITLTRSGPAQIVPDASVSSSTGSSVYSNSSQLASPSEFSAVIVTGPPKSYSLLSTQTLSPTFNPTRASSSSHGFVS